MFRLFKKKKSVVTLDFNNSLILPKPNKQALLIEADGKTVICIEKGNFYNLQNFSDVMVKVGMHYGYSDKVDPLNNIENWESFSDELCALINKYNPSQNQSKDNEEDLYV